MDAETVAVGGRGQGDDGEETLEKEHKEEEDKEACCFAQGGEGEEA